MSRYFKDLVMGDRRRMTGRDAHSAHTAQGGGMGLAIVVILRPVSEALYRALNDRVLITKGQSKRIKTSDQRVGAVPGTSLIIRNDLKPADRRAVVEQHVHLRLRRHAPVCMAVRVELGGVALRLVERHRQGGVSWHCVHRLVRLRGKTGVDSPIRHFLADPRNGGCLRHDCFSFSIRFADAWLDAPEARRARMRGSMVYSPHIPRPAL